MSKKRPGLMERMSGAHPDQIAHELEGAQRAWDEGKLAYVCKFGALATVDSDAATEVIDGALRIGWSLNQAALAYNQTAMNTEEIMFVFVRP